MDNRLSMLGGNKKEENKQEGKHLLGVAMQKESGEDAALEELREKT